MAAFAEALVAVLEAAAAVFAVTPFGSVAAYLAVIAVSGLAGSY